MFLFRHFFPISGLTQGVCVCAHAHAHTCMCFPMEMTKEGNTSLLVKCFTITVANCFLYHIPAPFLLSSWVVFSYTIFFFLPWHTFLRRVWPEPSHTMEPSLHMYKQICWWEYNSRQPFQRANWQCLSNLKCVYLLTKQYIVFPWNSSSLFSLNNRSWTYFLLADVYVISSLFAHALYLGPNLFW